MGGEAPYAGLWHFSSPGDANSGFGNDTADGEEPSPFHDELAADGKLGSKKVADNQVAPANQVADKQQVAQANDKLVPPNQVAPANDKVVPPNQVAQAGDKPVTANDKIAPAGDATKAGADAANKAVDPYEAITRAQKAGQEIEIIVRQNRAPGEKIVIRADNGTVREVTVAQRVAELKTTVRDEVATARRAADSIRQSGDAKTPGVSNFITENIQNRDRLAKELKLDPSTLTPDSLKAEFSKAAGEAPENKDRREKIQELFNVVSDREDLERLKHAPAYTRLMEAEFNARGYSNPKLGLFDEIPNDEFARSFQLVKEAGRMDPELAASPVFLQADSTISLLYASKQQDRSAQIILDLKNATESGANRDSKKQEEYLKHAVELADKIPTGFIASQAMLPRNMESGVSKELIDITRITSNARLDYANFLIGEGGGGRFHEAQALLNQVKADNPELIYEQDPKTKEITYRKYNDKSYETLDRVVTLGVTINPGAFDGAQSRFFKKIQDGDIGAKDKMTGAWGDLATMIKTRDRMKEDMDKANLVLDREKTDLTQRKEKFDKNGELSPEDKQEKERIEREIKIIDNIVEQRKNSIARISALTEFSYGWLQLASQDFGNANKHFKAAQAADPTFAAEIDKMKERDSNIKSLAELTQLSENDFDGWWQRNHGKVAAAGAMAAGLLTGVGTIGVASSAGAGIFTTTVAATGAGALAGGGTYWGIERTVNPDAGWKEFAAGARIGGLSAGMVATPWARAALQAEGAVGVNAAINTSRIAGLARTLGITKGTLAGGMALSTSIEAGNMIFEGKSLKDAALAAGGHGIMNSMMFGIAGKWGVAKDAANIGRATMPQTFGYAGRAFLFQEGWDTAVNLGLYGYMHEAKGMPYQLTDGPGLFLPLAADYYQRRWGGGLDLSHPGDRTLFNYGVQNLSPSLGSSLLIDKKEVDAKKPVTSGLFFDYSKPADVPRK